MSSQTIYWAMLLDDDCVERLKDSINPAHSNVYAEHITLCFQPNDEQDERWMKRLGEDVMVTAIGRATDKKGDALLIDGIERDDGGIPHITISCAKGTKPFYSNALLAKGHDSIWAFDIEGIIARYTKSGWDRGEKKDNT